MAARDRGDARADVEGPRPSPRPHARPAAGDGGATPIGEAPSLRRRTAQLLCELDRARSPGGPGPRCAARDELVHLHLPLVEHCARQFRHHGETHEDLVQVGTIGLLKAIDRFETGREVEFSTYATPTILGEIRRHLRDQGWALRVPRGLKELRQRVTTAAEELTQALGRAPTTRELADHVGCSPAEVADGLASDNAFSALPLDALEQGEPASGALLGRLATEESALEHVELRELIRPELEALDARARRIVVLRFFGSCTQSQIAEEIGVSQMHVSRLLGRALRQLRAALQSG